MLLQTEPRRYDLLNFRGRWGRRRRQERWRQRRWRRQWRRNRGLRRRRWWQQRWGGWGWRLGIYCERGDKPPKVLPRYPARILRDGNPELVCASCGLAHVRPIGPSLPSESVDVRRQTRRKCGEVSPSLFIIAEGLMPSSAVVLAHVSGEAAGVVEGAEEGRVSPRALVHEELICCPFHRHAVAEISLGEHGACQLGCNRDVRSIKRDLPIPIGLQDSCGLETTQIAAPASRCYPDALTRVDGGQEHDGKLR